MCFRPTLRTAVRFTFFSASAAVCPATTCQRVIEAVCYTAITSPLAM